MQRTRLTPEQEIPERKNHDADKDLQGEQKFFHPKSPRRQGYLWNKLIIRGRESTKFNLDRRRRPNSLPHQTWSRGYH
jgi:hypothetical protein